LRRSGRPLRGDEAANLQVCVAFLPAGLRLGVAPAADMVARGLHKHTKMHAVLAAIGCCFGHGVSCRRCETIF